MARIINPVVVPATVTVEFTREEALVIRAICGRMSRTQAQNLVPSGSTYMPNYPKARKIIDEGGCLEAVYTALDAYFGTER